MDVSGKSPVYVTKTNDRRTGIRRLLERFDTGSFAGNSLALKANYNSADPFPASTHPETLAAIVDVLRENGARRVVLAERSGMGNTPDVLREMGIIDMALEKKFDIETLDGRENRDWHRHNVEGYHWKRGYLFSKIFSDADMIVQTCCLKTHRFGGHFTMSLKNSVGMVALDDPEDGYNYMHELHGSHFQREMIAEVNAAYSPALVIMDGLKAFTHGGPDHGTLVEPGLLLASTDRVAIDACGVAILRSYGTTPEVSRGDIFRLPQIARAVELDLGAKAASDVEIVPIDDSAKNICDVIARELQGTMTAKT